MISRPRAIQTSPSTWLIGLCLMDMVSVYNSCFTSLSVSLSLSLFQMDPVQKAVINHTFGVPLVKTKRPIISCNVCQIRFNSEVHYLSSCSSWSLFGRSVWMFVLITNNVVATKTRTVCLKMWFIYMKVVMLQPAETLFRSRRTQQPHLCADVLYSRMLFHCWHEGSACAI